MSMGIKRWQMLSAPRGEIKMCHECEYKDMCECKGEVKLRHAMTAYHWDGTGEDPNRDFYACDDHYEMYREYWQGMWDDYYGIVSEGIIGGLARRERYILETERESFQEQAEEFIGAGLRFLGYGRD